MNVDYPYHFSNLGQTATTARADHVRDMIEQLLFTSPGERVNRPDFGSGLRQALFAPNSGELATALSFTTRAGLQRWLGDVIDVQLVEVSAEDEVLRVLVQYALRSDGQPQRDVFERSAGA